LKIVPKNCEHDSTPSLHSAAQKTTKNSSLLGTTHLSSTHIET